MVLTPMIDLLGRERLSLIAGRDRVALDRLEILGGIDGDELLFGGEVEDIAQGGEIPLLGHWGEQGLALLFRSRDGLVDGEIAIKLGPVGWQPSQDRSHAKAGVVIDGMDGGLIADDFADQSYGGPLPVQPLGTEFIDGGILFDQPQVLLGELCRTFSFGVRVGSNSWSKNDRL